MDAELAHSVVEDVFASLGTPGCSYEPPVGAVLTGLTLIRHRRSGDRSSGGLGFGRGGFETTDRPQAIVVRRAEVAQPAPGGVFAIPARDGAGPDLRFRIGEDPVEDDVDGLTWRCSVVQL